MHSIIKVHRAYLNKNPKSLAVLRILLSNMSTNYYSDLQLMHGATGNRGWRPIRLFDRNYYCLQYNHAGTIQVKIDDQPEQTVQGPSLLITGPGHRFVFGSADGWHHNYIAFSGPRVKRYIETGLLPINQPLHSIEDSQAFFTQFEVCVNSFKANALPQACHALEGLLVQLQRQPARREEPHPVHEVRELAEAMRTNPAQDFDLEKEAAKIHISLAHLRRVFRQQIGSPPGHYLQQCRLSAAADLLASTRDPVKQIAEECRLGGVHYFTRIFRNQYGQPPARFRSEMLGE